MKLFPLILLAIVSVPAFCGSLGSPNLAHYRYTDPETKQDVKQCLPPYRGAEHKMISLYG